MCQETDTKNDTTEKFTHYVHYNEYGGVEKRIERGRLETILEDQERKPGWYLINTIWTLRREGVEIHAKLNPGKDLGSLGDDLWHSWNYTFIPEIL